MKKFSFDLAFFLLLTVSWIFIIFWADAQYTDLDSWSFWANADEYNNSPTLEITPIIEDASNSTCGYSKVIVGDSVCKQIFNRFQSQNEEYCTLGSNAAISIVGDFLLAQTFLNTHENVTDVYLCLRSLTGSGVGYVPYSYQYLVIPFGKMGLLDEIDDATWTDMKQVYGSLFLQPQMIRFLDASNIARKLYINKEHYSSINEMEIAIRQLERLQKMTMERGIAIHVIHAPVSEQAIDDITSEKENFYATCEDEVLCELMQKFYNDILYYPDDYFQDGVHFGEYYASDAFVGEVIELYQGSHILDGFTHEERE